MEERREPVRDLIGHIRRIKGELGQQEGQQQPEARLAAAPRQQQPPQQEPGEGDGEQ